jgi:hypothetical protein
MSKSKYRIVEDSRGYSLQWMAGWYDPFWTTTRVCETHDDAVKAAHEHARQVNPGKPQITDLGWLPQEPQEPQGSQEVDDAR